MRSHLEDNRLDRVDIQSQLWGVDRVALTGNFTIPDDFPFMLFLDPNGSDRDVTLPALGRGKAHIIENVGSANSLIIKTPAGATLTTLSNVQGAMFVCSGQEWKYLTNTIGDALDPTEIGSPDGSISVVIQGGTSIAINVNPSSVHHNSLAGYIAAEHINHTGVSVTVEPGLKGGGDISATRGLSLDLAGLSVTAMANGDYLGFSDSSDSSITRRESLLHLNTFLSHTALAGFVAAEHVNHSNVNINAGVGLTGGGNIAATRTISLDFLNMSSITPTPDDIFAFWDMTGAQFGKRSITTFLDDFGIQRTFNLSNVLRTPDIGVSVQGYDLALSSLANLSITADNMIYSTGVDALQLAALGAFARTALLPRVNASAVRSAIGVEIGVNVEAFDADILKRDVATSVSAGYSTTSYYAGTMSSGSYALSLHLGQVQDFKNAGAFTLSPPTAYGAMILDQNNITGAGVITRTGFTTVLGDTLNTTVGNKFRHFISVGVSGSLIDSRRIV